MALNLEAKKAVVEQVNAVAMSAVSVGAAEYRGLNVEQMTNLRNSAMEADVSLRVVKNTLAKRALAETGCECITPVLSGPVILGFSQEDPGAVARVFRDFIKENKIRGVVFLSGDRHLTEVYKINNPDFYPFYEITCSPFTPKPYDISKKEEFNNPARLEGSLVMEQNFMNIKIQGDRKNRELVIETYNIDNELKFKYSINKSDLSTSKNNY